MAAGKDKSSADMEDFAARLKKARNTLEEKDVGASAGMGSAYSFAFRIAIDLVVGLGVGFGIGWVLDYLLGTKPWFLLIFVILGMAAGILNVIRAAQSVEARRHLEASSQKAKSVPAVLDDDDDDDDD